jgi:hypothetical protein
MFGRGRRPRPVQLRGGRPAGYTFGARATPPSRLLSRHRSTRKHLLGWQANRGPAFCSHAQSENLGDTRGVSCYCWWNWLVYPRRLAVQRVGMPRRFASVNVPGASRRERAIAGRRLIAPRGNPSSPLERGAISGGFACGYVPLRKWNLHSAATYSRQHTRMEAAMDRGFA